MDITPYVETLRRDLGQAARAMGPDTAEAADRLGYALDSSVRLALMEALSHAAAEITNELEGRSVEVRLQGREPVFVVAGEGPVSSADTRAILAHGDTRAVDPSEEGDETSRITLRLPEALKGRAEDQAGSRGQSLNTWIVGAVRAALTSSPAATTGPGAPGRNRSSNKRVQGWVR
ncbi:MAG: histidine kinase [Terracoccus sp.]